MDKFASEDIFPDHVISELKEKNNARIDQRVKTGTHFINRCRRLKVADETDEGSPRPEARRNNVYEGYLWKQGRQFRGWKCYYFAIVDNQSVSFFYSNEGRASNFLSWAHLFWENSQLRKISSAFSEGYSAQLIFFERTLSSDFSGGHLAQLSSAQLNLSTAQLFLESTHLSSE